MTVDFIQIEQSPEVVYNASPVCPVSRGTIDELKRRAGRNTRRRARLCLHRDPADLIHQMVIVHRRDAYVRPHMHRKPEAVQAIEGCFHLVFFDESGEVTGSRLVGGEGDIVVRMEAGTWHTMLPASDWIVFHEITQGPFTGWGDSVFAPWAPGEDQVDAVASFLERLRSLTGRD